MFTNILIPTDGSRTAAKAIESGVALAKEMGAKVTGFCAQEPIPSHIYGEGYVADRKMLAEFERRAQEYAELCVDQVGVAARKAGVRFDSLVTRSRLPYQGIIEAAKKKKCDVIFMASHGRRGLAGLLLGSVTQEVLTHSEIPVLVFR